MAQATTAQLLKSIEQLERKQKALDSLSTTINSFQEKNSHAIFDLRTHVNGFLSELISVVGRQFEKMQADLKQSQMDTIKVCNCCCIAEQSSTVMGLGDYKALVVPTGHSHEMQRLDCLVDLQAQVQKALQDTYTKAAGKKMERWVHSKVTDITHRIKRQVSGKSFHQALANVSWV